MRPIRFAGLRIHAVHFASAIGDEREAIEDRRCGQNVLLQRIRPHLGTVRDVTHLRGINALQPRFILAPENVSTARDKKFAVKEDRHAENIARAFPAVRVEAMHFRSRGRRIEIELEQLLQRLHRSRPPRF